MFWFSNDLYRILNSVLLFLGSNLVLKAIRVMVAEGADEVRTCILFWEFYSSGNLCHLYYLSRNWESSEFHLREAAPLIFRSSLQRECSIRFTIYIAQLLPLTKLIKYNSSIIELKSSLIQNSPASLQFSSKWKLDILKLMRQYYFSFSLNLYK